MAYRFTVEDSVYVEADEIGRGLGRALLEQVIARCSELGYRQMVAVIGGRETLGSIRLHERLGFSPIGVLPAVGFKFGRWIDIEVLQLLAFGHTNRDIAEKLFISPDTVKTHLEHIFEKLGASDRTAAVAEALRRRLIE